MPSNVATIREKRGQEENEKEKEEGKEWKKRKTMWDGFQTRLGLEGTPRMNVYSAT